MEKRINITTHKNMKTNACLKPRSGEMQLHLEKISTFYGEAPALKEVSLSVNTNEVVALLGSNGAGKTTLLSSITGLLTPREGKILFRENEIQGLPPHRIIRRGMASVPEGRQLFGSMSVADNLVLGAYSMGRRERNEVMKTRLDMIFSLFPVLKGRLRQRVDTMSGGEQQMLAVGRALMADPKLLALDEPSLGLSPILVSQMMTLLKQICEEWRISVLLVEQNARAALKIADHVYVLERGEVAHQGTCEEMSENPAVEAAYLGG